MFPQEIRIVAEMLVDAAKVRRLRIATAESCTGGLVAAAITSIPGSSEVFERGFVTYSNKAKQEMLGVPGDLISGGCITRPVQQYAESDGRLQAPPRAACSGHDGPATDSAPMRAIATI